MKRKLSIAAPVIIATYTALSAACAADTLVFAAASLTAPLNRIIAGYNEQQNARVRVSYASSGALARQIDRGAPATVFISANRKWVDWLIGRGRLHSNPAAPYLTNALVIVRHHQAGHITGKTPHAIFRSLKPAEKIAIGDPAHVPAGQYARDVLVSMGLWNDLKRRVAPMQNVRAATALIERRAAPVGIIYKTDAVAHPGLKTLYRFPKSAALPIEYFLVRVRGNASPHSEALQAFLRTPPALAVWRAFGFGTVTE